VTREPDFRTIVGNDFGADEEARLRRAHELLIAAGPPPELSPELLNAPVEPERRRRTATVPGLPPPRRGRILALAFALGAVALVAGYIFGTRQNSFDTQYSVPMKGTAAAPGARAVIDVGATDDGGNQPLRMNVSGLRQLPKGAHYDLLLTRPGVPAVSCGTFRVEAGTTEVRFSVPYEWGNRYGWVVRAVRPSAPPSKPLLQVRVRRA
jgi:hypothetical protein